MKKAKRLVAQQVSTLNKGGIPAFCRRRMTVNRKTTRNGTRRPVQEDENKAARVQPYQQKERLLPDCLVRCGSEMQQAVL